MDLLALAALLTVPATAFVAAALAALAVVHYARLGLTWAVGKGEIARLVHVHGITTAVTS